MRRPTNSAERINFSEIRQANQNVNIDGFDYWDVPFGWTGSYGRSYASETMRQWQWSQYDAIRADVCSWRGHAWISDEWGFIECGACGACGEPDCCGA